MVICDHYYYNSYCWGAPPPRLFFSNVVAISRKTTTNAGLYLRVALVRTFEASEEEGQVGLPTTIRAALSRKVQVYDSVVEKESWKSDTIGCWSNATKIIKSYQGKKKEKKQRPFGRFMVRRPQFSAVSVGQNELVSSF